MAALYFTEIEPFGARWRAALASCLPGPRRDAEVVRPSSPLPPADRVCALVFIANLAQLADTDGPEVAAGVSREIRRRLFAAFPPSGDTDLSCLRDDCFLLRTRHAQLDDLLAALGREPILVKGIAAQPQLHADWIALRDSGPMSPAEIELALWAAQPHPAPTVRARPASDVVVDDIEHVYDLRIARQGDALWLRERCLRGAEERARIDTLFAQLQPG
ncbi:hypothetical protein [Variovorax sp. EBFNA2]|uniref:hypothetical protein n=1 Tax=Variovorax sp. EBFNA2 TaxID=3342097 RepID=UPI0029C00E81|nr:hypothetical protein [Variovorax boronicumulans]WPG40331.1 hypothetical protein RZE79_13565 [Variovorax boronicumulans]